MIEQGLFDLLRRIAGDYDLDYNDLCERYMSAPGPEPTVPVVRKVSSGSTCKGKTAKGLSCKKKSVDGCDGYCKTHAPKEEEVLESESEVEVDICKGMTGKKQPCKKKAADGCDGYCKTHKGTGPFRLEPVHSHAPGDVDEECDACSSYGDPVNSPVSKREFTIVRRSERLMKQAEIVEDEEDEEDMLEFAKALQEQMEAEGILDE